MAEIFISYKSERRPAARHLAKVLGAYGFDAWYDYGLIPGEDFERRLTAEMAAANVILVLWCRRATASDWVNREAREAVRTGKYLPCRIEATALPEEFARADTISLTEWDGAPRSNVLDRLLADIARRLDRDPLGNFNRIRELDEDWRGYGAPSLAEFALGEALTPESATTLSVAKRRSKLEFAAPPAELSPDLVEHWKNAQSGEPESLLRIAWHYENGRGGLPQDKNEAVRLYKLAATQGNMHAQSNLGYLYQTGGGGLPQDEREAARLYRLAADQGNAGAQANLASMYRAGRGGLPKDDAEAVRLYKLAADHGNMYAQSDLGYLFESGQGGLAKDVGEAIRLYTLAAQQGNEWAEDRLQSLRDQA